MIFEPAPRNDFAEFITLYYERCRSVAPEVEGIAGKWAFEDLIPGMSDFDYRLICADGMTADDWCRVSAAVGEMHLELCRAHPEWTRRLEHLPGVSLTWSELTLPQLYHPEYKQWTFYDTAQPERLARVTQALASRPWDAKDERYNLSKFLAYYGPYNRAIDPAINLGAYENKYPLHSRLMHYFPPPVQSALAILGHQTLVGKIDALRRAAVMFPNVSVFAEALDIVERHYEIPELYSDPALSDFEERLFDAVRTVGLRLADAITIIPGAACTSPAQWQQALSRQPVDLAMTVFDGAKYARLTKGRIYFLANAPSYFDTSILIPWELNRVRNTFFRQPLAAFWELLQHEKIEDPLDIVPRLAPDILTTEEVEATLAAGQLSGTWRKGQEVATARRVVEVFDGFYRALHKISAVAIGL